MIKVELREIPGLSPNYLAGSDGFVYSTKKLKRHDYKPFRLYFSINAHGYGHARFTVDKVSKWCRIHTLICRAFHGEKPHPDYQVRHLDGNKTNNHPDNLCWGTRKENEADKHLHGTALFGSRANGAKLKEDDVIEIRRAYGAKESSVANLAETYGVSTRAIYYAIKGTQRWARI